MMQNRFEEIAGRQRESRVHDIAFALIMAAVLALAISSVRVTGLLSYVGDEPATAAPAPLDLLSSTSSCTTTPTC